MVFRFVRPFPPLPSSIQPSSTPSTPSTPKSNPESQAKSIDPITLFHKPSSPSSSRVLQILKQASASAEAGTLPASSRGEFQLEITTAPPTTDQLRNILDYVTANPAGAGQNKRQYAIEEVIRGAKDAEEAVKRFKEDPEGSFVRPVVCSYPVISFLFFFFLEGCQC